MNEDGPAVARAAFAKRLVVETAPPADPLKPWERETYLSGGRSVQLRVPLDTIPDLLRNLQILQAATIELIEQIKNGGNSDRTNLVLVRGVLKQVNVKINAYRKPRI